MLLGRAGPTRAAQPPRRFLAPGLVALGLVVATSAALSTMGSAASVPASGPPGRWQLVFDAAFSGAIVNRSLWRTCYDWACTNDGNDEAQVYESGNVNIAKNTLTLTARPEVVGGRTFTSGMIQSNGHMDFRYGLVVVKARVPVAPGAWPALWLLPSNNSWPPELDLMEFYGSRPGLIHETVHLGADDETDQLTLPWPQVDSGYHTFTLDWEPNMVTWYVDGRRTFHVRVRVSSMMYLLANLAVQGGTPADSVGYPAQFRIAWIKVFQHPGLGTLHCSARACR